MTSIKSDQEIKIMKKGGQIAAFVMEKVLENIKPGVSKRRLDDIARQEIKHFGVQPSFTTVPGYRWVSCITINEEVVHGVPNEDRLAEGDIVSVDLGVLYHGFHTDMARTIVLGRASKEQKVFLEAGKRALKLAIQACKVGARVGDISAVIQDTIESQGYSIVRALTGHGIGRKLHEDPQVPGFRQRTKDPILREGMTLAIEVIYTMGGPDVCYKGNDGWTIQTKDGSLAGLFEDTVAITKSGPIVLTRVNDF